MADSLDLADLTDLPAVGESKGSALSAGTAGSADTVYIILNILRNVIIDDGFHIVHVDTSGRHIRGDQNAGSTVAETVHSHIPLCLRQIAVQSFCLKSLLFQQIRQLVHLFLRITEDQGQFRLIVLQQSHTGGILVLIFHAVKLLGYQRDRQLLCRYLYQLCILLEPIRDLQNRLRHGRGKQGCLVLSGDLSQNQLHVFTEAHVQHLVRLIQYHHVHHVQLDGMSAHVVHDTSRGSHDDLHAPQSCDLAADILSTVNRQHLDAVHVFGDFPQLLCCLDCQFSGGT